MTVVRGECCKPRRSGRTYMEQRADDLENSLFYHWNKEQLNNNNNTSSSNNYNDHKSDDSIFKQRLTGDPTSNMNLDTYFNNNNNNNNNNINNYINNRPQQSHDPPLIEEPLLTAASSSSTPEFYTSDFETVFLLDPLVEVGDSTDEHEENVPTQNVLSRTETDSLRLSDQLRRRPEERPTETTTSRHPRGLEATAQGTTRRPREATVATAENKRGIFRGKRSTLQSSDEVGLLRSVRLGWLGKQQQQQQ